MTSAEYGISGTHANLHAQQNKSSVNQNVRFLNYHSPFHGLPSCTNFFLFATNLSRSILPIEDASTQSFLSDSLFRASQALSKFLKFAFPYFLRDHTTYKQKASLYYCFYLFRK